MLPMITKIMPHCFQHVRTVWGWFFGRTINGNLRKIERRGEWYIRISLAKIFDESSVPDPLMGDAKFVCERQGKERVRKIWRVYLIT